MNEHSFTGILLFYGMDFVSSAYYTRKNIRVKVSGNIKSLKEKARWWTLMGPRKSVSYSAIMASSFSESSWHVIVYRDSRTLESVRFRAWSSIERVIEGCRGHGSRGKRSDSYAKQMYRWILRIQLLIERQDSRIKKSIESYIYWFLWKYTSQSKYNA